MAAKIYGRFRVRTAFGLAFFLLVSSTAWAQGRGAQTAPPRIVAFEARPNSIRPGESTVLVWRTETSSGITIEPGIGPVTARGTKQVTPPATTTFTLTIPGRPSSSLPSSAAGTTPFP